MHAMHASMSPRALLLVTHLTLSLAMFAMAQPCNHYIVIHSHVCQRSSATRVAARLAATHLSLLAVAKHIAIAEYIHHHHPSYAYHRYQHHYYHHHRYHCSNRFVLDPQCSCMVVGFIVGL